MSRGHVLRRSIVVPASLDVVFAFFADPRRLALITPPWLGFRLMDPDTAEMRRGARLEYRIRPFGFAVRWVSEITVWDPPHEFVDVQLVGPYASWHHEHRFTATHDATTIADHVEYGLPLGPIGSLARLLLVQHQLRAIFDYRERVIRRTFQH